MEALTALQQQALSAARHIADEVEFQTGAHTVGVNVSVVPDADGNLFYQIDTRNNGHLETVHLLCSATTLESLALFVQLFKTYKGKQS
jgi:hypothetical protein